MGNYTHEKIIICHWSSHYLLSGCKSPLLGTTEPVTERMDTEFDDWNIPGDIHFKRYQYCRTWRFSDSGLGDEFKRGGYFTRLTNEMTELARR